MDGLLASLWLQEVVHWAGTEKRHASFSPRNFGLTEVSEEVNVLCSLLEKKVLEKTNLGLVRW